jgi:hypothetical protein
MKFTNLRQQYWQIICANFYTRIEEYVVHAVAHLVEALRYKPEGRGFDSRWCNWIFLLT